MRLSQRLLSCILSLALAAALVGLVSSPANADWVDEPGLTQEDLAPAPPDDPENDLWVYDQSELDGGEEPTGEVSVMALPVVLWAVGMAVVRAGASTAVKRSVVVKASSQTAAKTAAKRAMTNAGGRVKSVSGASQARTRAHTARNVRHNLSVRTGHTKVNYSAHHRIPAKYRADMKKWGVNVDNPKFTLWWCGTSHFKNAAAYNADWDPFVRRVRANPKMQNAKTILAHMDTVTRRWSGSYACPPGTKTPV